jgi:hypothetical protein
VEPIAYSYTSSPELARLGYALRQQLITATTPLHQSRYSEQGGGQRPSRACLAGRERGLANHRDEVSAWPMPFSSMSTSGWLCVVFREACPNLCPPARSSFLLVLFVCDRKRLCQN